MRLIKNIVIKTLRTLFALCLYFYRILQFKYSLPLSVSVDKYVDIIYT